MSLIILFWDAVISRFRNINFRTLILYMHIAVFMIFTGSVLHFLFVLLTTDFNFTDKYFKQGFDNKNFLFCAWATGFHIIYFGIYALIEIISICGRKSKQALKMRKMLYDVGNFILFSIVFPLTIFTASSFWAFYFWDKEHVFPKELEKFPSYLNQMMHTVPLPLIILYMFADVRKEPDKYKTLPPLLILLLIYGLVFYDVRRRKGVWVYPVFEFLTFSQIIWLGAFTLVATIFCHFLGYYLFNIIRDIRSSIISKLEKMENTSTMMKKSQ